MESIIRKPWYKRWWIRVKERLNEFFGRVETKTRDAAVDALDKLEEKIKK